jgi:hypothetical protein
MELEKILGMTSQGLGAIQQVGDILGIGHKKQDKRQLEQQEKLSEQQARIQNQAQMKMWEDTNYSAQVEQLNKAGLNPGLLYGKGGGGGTTVGGGISGGQAANAAATQTANTQSRGMAIQQGMMMAQLEVMKSQANKNDAEAEAIRGYKATESGASAAESASRKASIDFQNELNKTIGIKDMAERYSWASDMTAIQSQKMNAEYEAWKTAGFEGKSFDDPNSPMAKAMKAGYEKTIQDLEKAKLENNAQKATNVVKNFEAELASQGIHPHSPWWTKLIGDMLEKVGIMDMIKGGQKEVKQQISQ